MQRGNFLLAYYQLHRLLWDLIDGFVLHSIHFPKHQLQLIILYWAIRGSQNQMIRMIFFAMIIIVFHYFHFFKVDFVQIYPFHFSSLVPSEFDRIFSVLTRLFFILNSPTPKRTKTSGKRLLIDFWNKSCCIVLTFKYI